jgi:hypothetical protein
MMLDKPQVRTSTDDMRIAAKGIMDAGEQALPGSKTYQTACLAANSSVDTLYVCERLDLIAELLARQILGQERNEDLLTRLAERLSA